jgi:N-glycosylase/DNA lyase
MNSYAPETLSKAVAAICPDIQFQVENAMVLDERRMWWELSCCILSSQVPYTLAVAAADEIDKQGLLHKVMCSPKSIVAHLVEILSSPLLVEGKYRNYRFPIARAHQLAATHSAVLRKANSLNDLINSFSNAAKGRDWLVNNAPGLGPKQASMFLRNVGISYELAILDRHVLNYMTALGIYSGKTLSISGLTQYRHYEIALREHAKGLNCAVGMLDWAIWIVMRVANKNKESVLI